MADSPNTRHWRVLIYIVLFLFFAGISLLSTLYLAKTFYPREYDPLEMALQSMPATPQPGKPWWKRVFDFDRVPTDSRGRQGKNDNGAQVDRVGTGHGAPASNLSEEQLALREIGEAQVILRSQSGISETEALRRMRKSGIQGPFKSFEEERLVSRLLLVKYLDDQSNHQVLTKLKESAERAAKDPHASFEEAYYAGIACLLAGENDKAFGYLNTAIDTWPSRGRGYGNVFLFLMVSHAIRGESDTVIQMLGELKATYPDWLYVETYMPDMDDLEAVYPEATMIPMIKGFMYTIVLNFGEAEKAHHRALEAGGLDGSARDFIREQLDAIRRERDR